MNGTQASSRSRGLPRFGGVVGERSNWVEVVRATNGGPVRSENAGMSNDKHGENPCRRKPKVS